MARRRHVVQVLLAAVVLVVATLPPSPVTPEGASADSAFIGPLGPLGILESGVAAAEDPPSTTPISRSPKPPATEDVVTDPSSPFLRTLADWSSADLGPIEPYATYEPQATCDPTPKPGAAALSALLLRTHPETTSGGIVRACELGPTSEHKEGRAVDWGISGPQERASAEQVLGRLLATDAAGNAHALARRMGVMYIIWDGWIWGAYLADEGWRPYHGPQRHGDHVHISLSWDGALGRTSLWRAARADGWFETVPVTGQVPRTDPPMGGELAGPPLQPPSPAGSDPVADGAAPDVLGDTTVREPESPPPVPPDGDAAPPVTEPDAPVTPADPEPMTPLPATPDGSDTVESPIPTVPTPGPEPEPPVAPEPDPSTPDPDAGSEPDSDADPDPEAPPEDPPPATTGSPVLVLVQFAPHTSDDAREDTRGAIDATVLHVVRIGASFEVWVVDLGDVGEPDDVDTESMLATLEERADIRRAEIDHALTETVLTDTTDMREPWASLEAGPVAEAVIDALTGADDHGSTEGSDAAREETVGLVDNDRARRRAPSRRNA